MLFIKEDEDGERAFRGGKKDMEGKEKAIKKPKLYYVHVFILQYDCKPI